MSGPQMKEGTDPIQLPQPTPGDPDGYDYFRVNTETFYKGEARQKEVE